MDRILGDAIGSSTELFPVWRFLDSLQKSISLYFLIVFRGNFLWTGDPSACFPLITCFLFFLNRLSRLNRRTS